jgi:hypothetical protein
MEPKKMTVNLYAMRFGLFLAIALIIFDLILYVFKAPIGSFIQYFSLVIVVAFIAYGTFTYRNNYSNGFIRYGQSFLSCFLIALYAGIIFAVYKYFFLKFFDHNMVLTIKEFAKEKMAEKFPEDKVDQMMAIQKYVYTPFFLAVSGIINTAVWGIAFSLIVSIFIKKEDKSFEAATNTEQL